MKHLIVGDNHGWHHNLRKLLLQEGVINKKGAAINRDEFKVYCTGDLIDGEINRAGDILNLQLMSEWFDAVCIGNHEYAFLGGRDFGSRRKHDRETVRLLLQRLDEGRLVPSAVVKGHLLTHSGLSKEFDFRTAEDANEFIHAMWDAAPEYDKEIAIFDWKNNSDYHYNSADPTSGIFNLAWKKDRNENFPQVVGHSIFTNGPIRQEQDTGHVHYNIDVGAKEGKACGGIIIDDDSDEVTSVFWGERKFDNKTTTQQKFPLVGDYDYYSEYENMVGQRYGSAKKGYTNGSEDFLEGKNTTGSVESINSTNLNVGDKLLASWGEMFRVSKIDRGMGDVLLKSISTPGRVMNKELNSDWMVSFRRVQTVSLVDKEDKPEVLGDSNVIKLPVKQNPAIYNPVLSDTEIMEYYRTELERL